ncbi:HTH-type transcriptional regulator GltC [compost metagenome]|uniref:LysR family transcriptional regulator n=1 Tax=Serratia TaxID=613 RepID=UPI000FB94EC3|nr:LysR family transcriptional regulator [Serratia liquefaciens]MBI6160072.1 LysR family transcriptional regulator [Serratia liquefaciens]RYM71879.1 LysR family transcriptional regulator [Serratia liquefaciens]RYM81641.1 LysR family transcriptional regulator [Serratia liquefaciens]
MRLNLKQIEVFRAIMLTGSISGAAKLLHVSQPAVSRLIGYTEQRLGLTLFERIKGRLYPTPEARHLFVEVNSVYQGVQRVNEVAEDLIQNRMGHLRIACSPSLGQGLIPSAIAKFHAQLPEARVILHTMIPDVLLQAVLTQQVELGVAFLHEGHPNVYSRQLYENRLVVALPASHPLTAKNVIGIEDLIDQPFIGYGAEIPIGQLVRKLLSDADIILRPTVEVQQIHVACALVQAGVGIALIDEITANGPVWTKVVFRPIEPTAKTPISIVHGMYEPLSRLAQAFIATLESVQIHWSR